MVTEQVFVSTTKTTMKIILVEYCCQIFGMAESLIERYWKQDLHEGLRKTFQLKEMNTGKTTTKFKTAKKQQK